MPNKSQIAKPGYFWNLNFGFALTFACFPCLPRAGEGSNFGARHVI
jgi:hypothetical protein